MKGIVNTYLNERIERPEVNADSRVYYEPGDEVEIVDILNGDDFEGNNVWYELDNGAYVWSGGVDGNRNIVPQRSVEIHDEHNDDLRDGGLDLREAWPLIRFDGFTGKEGANIRVAVIDSGYNAHDDIGPNRIHGLNLRKENSDGSFSTFISDDVGHGTHMSGLIGAGGNMVGFAPKCKISMLKIFEEEMRDAKALDLIPTAILKAIGLNAQVISLSLETSLLSDDLQSAIDSAISQNIVVVGSIGTNSTRVKPPGIHPDVIGVGNCFFDENSALKPLLSSGKGNQISCVAFGVDVPSLSNILSDDYKTSTGPSVSVAIVAGIIANVLSEFTKTERMKITPAMVKSAVEVSAIKAGFTGYHQKFGHGLINPTGILEMIKSTLKEQNGDNDSSHIGLPVT